MIVRRKIWLAVVFATGIITSASVAQQTNPGIVVEKVEKNSEAAKAGLQEGDLLLRWRRGDAQGETDSPFQISQIEIEQEPRGSVTLEGLRGNEKQTWTLGPASWRLAVRPSLSEALLTAYTEGRTLAEAGKLKEAEERWLQAAAQIERPEPAWLRVWFLEHAADQFFAENQWAEASDGYQKALQQTDAAGPLVRTQLLRSLALTYQKRNDWTNAEKYYQQLIAENGASENLTVASTLNELGRTADARGDLAKAADYYHQGLVMREKLAPESLAVAASLNGLGALAVKRGDLPKAGEYLQRASAICEKLSPDGLDVAVTFNNLGYLSRVQGDLAKAEEYYRKAFEIGQRIAPESLDDAASLNGLGVVTWYRGDLVAAENYYRQSLAIKKKVAPGSLDVANALSNLGIIAWPRGELAEAEEYYRQALAIYEKLAPESVGMANVLSNMGSIFLERNDLAEAERCYRHALAIREQKAPESIEVGFCLNNLGNVALWGGDKSKAEDYFRRALIVKEKAAPESLVVAVTLNQLGSLAFDRGQFDEAEQYYLRALAIRERLAAGSIDVGESQTRLGDVARQHNDLNKAEEYYRQSLAIREKMIPESKEHAETLADLAGILQRKQQPELAATLYEKALNVLERSNALVGGSETIRADFRAKFQAYYKDYIDLLISQKQTESAFQVLESSRARTLLETLSAAHVDLRKDADAALLKQERGLWQSYKAISDRRIKLLSGQHTEEQVAAMEKEVSSLLREYEDVEGRIRATSPNYAAIIQPPHLNLKEVQQQLLEPDSLLLEYSLGQERSYVFAVTRESFSVYTLPKQSEIESAARRVHDMLVARSHKEKGETNLQWMKRAGQAETQYPEAAAALSRMVLEPVSALLPGKRLLIVSDGILQYVPFSALPSPTKGQAFVPLVADHEVVNLPSISVLQVLRENAAHITPSKALAVLADPVFSTKDRRVRQARIAEEGKSQEATERGGPETSKSHAQASLLRSATDIGLTGGEFPRLFFTRREADVILKQSPESLSMKAVDFKASLATATNPELAQYRIVHFATHGLLDSEHPEFSGLVLSLVDEQGKPQDGFLQLTDIYNLKLPVDLVVLSACETGLGKEVKGEGLVGITRGFMYAGASRVVASLWKVDDAATAELMGKFYKGIFQDNLQPAAALQRAQVEMWKQKRWHSPYYWAGFVLQGQW